MPKYPSFILKFIQNNPIMQFLLYLGVLTTYVKEESEKTKNAVKNYNRDIEELKANNLEIENTGNEIMISKELENVLKRAYRTAKNKKHEYITLEHILHALTFDKDTVDILVNCGSDIKELRKELDTFINESIPSIGSEFKEVEPLYTLAVQRVLQMSAIHVQGSERENITGSDILVSMYKEKNSHAVYFLSKQKITRLDILKYIAHGISKTNNDEESETIESVELDSETPAQESKKINKALETYCVNLNQKAIEGKIDPLIGRSEEVERIVHILSRRRKNNPILVGDSGVGKTAVVEGLASRIVSKDVPKQLHAAVIQALDIGLLLAGTKFRGQFEERMKAVLSDIKKDENAILFIDEIHTIIGAGATSGGSLDASNILKPYLSNGELKCIGSSTYQDYKNYFEKDKALSRRFQKIEIKEPSIEETFLILKGLKSHYEKFHDVSYTDEALRASAELSAKYINELFLPDKAIDVIDEAGASLKLKTLDKPQSERIVTEAEIENIISKITKLPAKTVNVNDKEKLKNLDLELKKLVFGQNDAIEQVVTAIKLSRSGLCEPNKPVGSFLFCGPTGVGKTEIAKQLANILGVEFIRFDMSEYMEKHTVSRLIGAPPGYVGFDQGGLMTDAIHRHPHSLLLLDEIEKAHPDLFNILLQVMDNATLTDNNGRKSDFRNVIIIMTTNAGGKEMSSNPLGFAKTDNFDFGIKAVENLFSPEFRNRLTSIIQFRALDQIIMESVVDKFVNQLNERLFDKKVSVELDNLAKAYLAKKGYEPAYGARPLGRVIQKEISQIISEEILFGKLENGGKVKISALEDKLKIEYFSLKDNEIILNKV